MLSACTRGRHQEEYLLVEMRSDMNILRQKQHGLRMMANVNCGSELNCHPAVFRFAFVVHGELEALVECV